MFGSIVAAGKQTLHRETMLDPVSDFWQQKNEQSAKQKAANRRRTTPQADELQHSS